MKKSLYFAGAFVLCLCLFCSCTTQLQTEPEPPAIDPQRVLEQYINSGRYYKDYFDQKQENGLFDPEVLALAQLYAEDTKSPLPQRMAALFLLCQQDINNGRKDWRTQYPTAGKPAVALINGLDLMDDIFWDSISARTSAKDRALLLDTLFLAAYDSNPQVAIQALGQIRGDAVPEKNKGIWRELSVLEYIFSINTDDYYAIVAEGMTYTVSYTEEEIGYHYVKSAIEKRSSKSKTLDSQLALVSFVSEEVMPRIWQDAPYMIYSLGWGEAADSLYIPHSLVPDYTGIDGTELDLSFTDEAPEGEYITGKMLVVSRDCYSGEAGSTGLAPLSVCSNIMACLPPELVPSKMDEVDVLLLIDTDYQLFDTYYVIRAGEIIYEEPIKVFMPTSTFKLYNWREKTYIGSLEPYSVVPEDRIFTERIKNHFEKPYYAFDIIRHLILHMGIEYPAYNTAG